MSDKNNDPLDVDPTDDPATELARLLPFLEAYDRSSLSTAGAKRLRRRISASRRNIIVHFADPKPGGDVPIDLLPSLTSPVTENAEAAWIEKNALLWYHLQREARWRDLEAKASDKEDDAIQRRITDARIRAVEQLGSGQAAVRIGGLHNLERIGELHDELRQVVLDEVCAYLRQSFTRSGLAVQEQLPERQFEPVGLPPAKADGGDEAEHEVRLIAQEILQRHLHPDHPNRYWTHTHLNLRGAHLDSLNLGGCHLTGADFTGVTFGGNANFKRVTFTGFTYFKRACFDGVADFGDVTFGGHATFENVAFTGNANFRGASFSDVATFAGATFGGNAIFADATFEGGVELEAVRFQSTLLAISPTLVEVLRAVTVRLRLDVEHQLPEGWGLVPHPTASGWGSLINQAVTDPG